MQPDFLRGWVWKPDVNAYTIPRGTEDGLFMDENGRLWNVETVMRADGQTQSYATLAD